MTLIRCYGCRHMFPTTEGECPECETPRRKHNKWLRTAQLNGQLQASVASAHNERKIGAALKAGVELPAPKWAQKRAKQIVADL